MVHLGDEPKIPPTPRGAPLTRRQITDVLIQAFGITQKFDTIRVLFKRFGITPLEYGVDPLSGRGNVGFYDPLVVWVLATYFSWPKLAHPEFLQKHENEAEGQPADVAWYAASLEALSRRCVNDDATRRYAYYWFISRREYGIDIRALDAAVERHPEVLAMTLDSPEILREVLQLYKQSVIEWSLGRAVQEIDRVELHPQFDVQHVVVDSETGATETRRRDPGPPDGPDIRAVMQVAGLYDPTKE